MRIVTDKHLADLDRALTAVQAMSRQGADAARRADAEFKALRREGQEHDACELGMAAIAAAPVLEAKASAQLEAAALAFLGIARRPDEDLAAYMTRIHAACTNLSTMKATQYENGILFKP